ncbi:hypothetical protein BKA80DRAFT_275579 [Phyllosticta citrichinensis]
MPRKRSSDQPPRDRHPSGRGLLENPEFSMQNLTDHRPSGLQDNPLPQNFDHPVVPNWDEEAQAYGNFQQNWQPPPAGYTPATRYGEPTPQVQATPYNQPTQHAESTPSSQLTHGPPVPFGQPTPYNAPTQYNAPTAYLRAQLFPLRDPTPYNMPTLHAQPDPNFRATANIERTPSGQPNPYIQQEGPHSHGHEHGQVEYDASQDASANLQHSQNNVQQGENKEGGGIRRRRRRRRRASVPCPNCDKHFDHKTSLVRHAKVTHNENPIRPVCRFCGKSFGRNDTLMRHLRDKHDGALP